MINPYETLGVASGASDEQIKSAYRQLAKERHPDAGGDPEAFMRMQRACDLLLDPLRRKVFDATGYDPDVADPADLQGALIIETLVNDIVLDERQAGSFDPLAGMRAKLQGEIHKANFHIQEMERHKKRLSGHIDRLEKRPETDVLGFMLKSRIDTIAASIAETRRKIEATERACDMLRAYSYAVDVPEPAGQALKSR